MKKLILFVLCALSGLMVSAQSRWGITPEGGFAAVNRVGMGSSWRAGVKVGVGVSYQFEPGWIGLKSGLYYANRGYSLGDYPRTTESSKCVFSRINLQKKSCHCATGYPADMHDGRAFYFCSCFLKRGNV